MVLRAAALAPELLPRQPQPGPELRPDLRPHRALQLRGGHQVGGGDGTPGVRGTHAGQPQVRSCSVKILPVYSLSYCFYRQVCLLPAPPPRCPPSEDGLQLPDPAAGERHTATRE